MEMSYSVLNNGVKMPRLGFGTAAIEKFQSTSDTVTRAITHAIKCGYRHIDTATIYGNERNVGTAIKNSGIDRSEFFVTSKVWTTSMGYDETLAAFDTSLKTLGFDYLDLYLIHWPKADHEIPTWRAMEKLYAEKKIRAIGVSNFSIEQINELMEKCEVTPACNQVELHPYRSQVKLRAECRAAGVEIVSYSPLGTGSWSDILDKDKPINSPVIKKIADDIGKSPSQVIIAWNLLQNLPVLPKSENPKHIEDNFAAIDVSLSPEQMEKINALNCDKRLA